MVTPACDHDSQELETLLENQNGGQLLYANSAYSSQEAIIEECEMSNEIHEKGRKGNPLTKEQKASNRVKSKSRARVKHVLGLMTNSMNAMYVRTIVYARAVAKIGLSKLTYNLMRCTQLNKRVITSFSGDNYAQSWLKTRFQGQ